MYLTERENEIMRLLEGGNKKSVEEIAKSLYISPSTVRRNLAAMEEKNLVVRTHGGVKAENAYLADHTPSFLREGKNAEKKRALAEKAKAYLADGETIFLDDTTTSLYLLPHIEKLRNVTVITNGVRACYELCKKGISVVMLGGNVISENFSVIGAETLRALSDLYADKAFVSCRYLSDDGVASDDSVEETYVRKAMLAHAKQKILLVDGTKLHGRARHALCRIDEIDRCICDEPLPWDKA